MDILRDSLAFNLRIFGQQELDFKTRKHHHHTELF